MKLDLEQFNLSVQAWGSDTAQAIKAAGTGLGIQHRPGSPSPKPSLQQLVARYKMDAGLVHVVSFRFPRSLIWTHKGAGKGMGGTVGSTWADQRGETKSTSPGSRGKMGTGTRQAKPFINNTLAGSTDQLAEIVTTQLGDAFINNLLIK